MREFIFLLIFLNSNISYSKKIDEFKDRYTCFNVKLIKLNFSYDRIRWDSEDLTDVCDLSLEINSTIPRYFYLTRRWRSPAYCKNFKKEWQKLKIQDRKVCIAASFFSPDLVIPSGKMIKEQTGYWEVLKSENWCHSYFVGNCKGFKKGAYTDSY